MGLLILFLLKMYFLGIKALDGGKNLHTKRFFGGWITMNEPNKNLGQNKNGERKENVEKKTEKKPVRKFDFSVIKQAIWNKLAQWKKMSKEKKFYLYTAMSCAAALVMILVIAVALANGNDVNTQAGKDGIINSAPIVDSTDKNENQPTDDKPVVNTPQGMVMPLEAASLGNDYGFYYNKTLNSYYEHAGVDFVAAEGTEIYAVEDGIVESIYKDDLLSGTEIVLNHGNGLKSVYRFVKEADNIKVGNKVKKGAVIATVAEASGDEYKDGAHLHFEILKNNVSVDPATYLTLEEK